MPGFGFLRIASPNWEISLIRINAHFRHHFLALGSLAQVGSRSCPTAGPAYPGQLAHAVDAQWALSSHPGTDLGIEALPSAPLIAASASILRKALSKKSSSCHWPPIMPSMRATLISSARQLTHVLAQLHPADSSFLKFLRISLRIPHRPSHSMKSVDDSAVSV